MRQNNRHTSGANGKGFFHAKPQAPATELVLLVLLKYYSPKKIKFNKHNSLSLAYTLPTSAMYLKKHRAGLSCCTEGHTE